MKTRRLPQLTPIACVAAALSVAAVFGTAGFLVGRYPSLTPYVPVHFGAGGIANRWRPKSWALVLMPVWVQLSLGLVCGAIVVILLWRAAPSADPVLSADPVPPTSPRDDDARRMVAAAEAVLLLALVWIAFQMLGAVQLVSLWERGWGGLGSLYGAGGVAAIIMSGVVGIRAMTAIGHPPKRNQPDEGPFWRLKLLYVNPRNPALFVPARRGVGWTLNFGRPTAVLLMALVLLLGIGAPVLIVRWATY